MDIRRINSGSKSRILQRTVTNIDAAQKAVSLLQTHSKRDEIQKKSELKETAVC
jgi:hypothetical protein